MKEKLLFTETQKFNQWWLWLVLIGLALIPAVITYNTIDRDDLDWGAKLMPIIIFVIIALFIFVTRMRTEITEKEITIHYFPMVKKRFQWEELTYAKVVDYGFVGGWGIRLWTSYGTVYNVRGSKGLHIKTAGKQFLIGTQKEEELRSKIAHLLR